MKDRIIEEKSKLIRQKTLEIVYRSSTSHIGTALSCIEILNGIYSSIDIQRIREKAKDRDRIILSKGHGTAALYSCLSIYGLMEEDELETFAKDNTMLTSHPAKNNDMIEYPSGALGHGASVGVGIAYGLKMQGYTSKVFVILGDGELHEGSNWEAFMLANTLKLDNIYFFIDRNRLSGINISDCCNLESLEAKFSAFGFETKVIEGHDEEAIKNEIKRTESIAKPCAIICNTVKGKGISFMENDNVWHYRPINDKIYKEALSELRKEGRA